jgi:peptidyl-prolyl cis-trans isomerase SurA
MRRVTRALGLTIAFATAAASIPITPRVAHAEIVDRVVAIVEDDAIFLSDVERRIRPFERQLEQLPNARERADQRARLYRETLDRMVDDALIRRAAQRAHVTVNDADVDRMIEGMARQRNVSTADIYAAIQQEGLTRQEYRSFMESEVLRLRLMNVRVRNRVNISEPDIAEEYRRRVREANDHAPFHAAHIFFAFPDAPTAAQIAQTQQRAEAAVAQLRQGADFAQLASQISDDVSTREQGGDLGMINPESDEAPPPEWLVDALRDLRPGQISGAVRGENGYHVFRLIERQPVTIPPLADVRNDLFNELLQREMERQQRAYLRELRDRSSVVVRP